MFSEIIQNTITCNFHFEKNPTIYNFIKELASKIKFAGTINVSKHVSDLPISKKFVLFYLIDNDTIWTIWCNAPLISTEKITPMFNLERITNINTIIDEISYLLVAQ